MFRYKYKIFVLIILMLRICSTNSQLVTPKTKAHLQAQTLQQETNSTSVSSYFRQDPYGPNTYAFGYEVDDKNTNNVQFRDERRYLNGTIVGSYGYVRPDGRITLTRYLADKEHGYHTHTQLFQPGEEQKVAAARWPSLTNAAMQPSQEHANQHHNQQHMLSPEVIEAVKEKHGIDLSNKDVSNTQHSHHDTSIADVINGEVPLSLLGDNKTNVLGFETVNKFIPHDFPIVPFELPTHLQDNADADAATHDKYEHAKENNAEKTLPHELLKAHAEGRNDQLQHAAIIDTIKQTQQHQRMLQNQAKPLDHDAGLHNLMTSSPKPLVDAESSEQRANTTWYKKVINEARQEFLQNLPSLQ